MLITEEKQWELIVQDSIGHLETKIWLVNKAGRIPTIASFDKGQLVMTEYKDGVDFPPSLSLPYYAWKSIKSAMLDNQEREKSEVEAELIATKRHLEDLRKIVSKKLGVNL
jgi:hypothetical protein